LRFLEIQKLYFFPGIKSEINQYDRYQS